MKVFCDTNVLLDVLTARDPFHADSAQVWDLVETGQVQGSVSALSLSNVFYVVRRLRNRTVARRAIVLARDVFQIASVDKQIINQAIDSDMRDFEDAIQLFGALRAQATCLITRDLRHFPHDVLPVQTPAQFLASYSQGDK